MENSPNFKVQNLVNELTKGKEMANQLQIHLHAPTSSHEIREILVNKIIDSYDKMLSMVKQDGHVGEKDSSMAAVAAIGGASESPRSLSGSPRSQDSDMELKDHDRNEASRKRKSMPRWTKHVQISPAMGPEGSLDDGYTWRKYGQKEILGAKYPRGYYRCTYRHTQNCLATKQVQRSDDNPTIFEVTYRAKHTCNQIITSLKSTSSSSTISPAEKQESNITNEDHQNPQKFISNQPDLQHNQLALLSNHRSDLKVITENLNTQSISIPADSFNFPSSSSSVISHEIFPFSPNFRLDNNFPSSVLPPISSDDLNYFLGSSSNHAQVDNFHQEQKFHTSDEQHVIPDLTSATTSATNSPTIGLDYTFSTMFSPNFAFDNPRFSS